MDQRGRKSTAEITTLRAVAPGERLPAPIELTPEQARIWDSVTETKPAEWFQRDTAPVLVEYCQTITRARQVEEFIASIEGTALADADNRKAYLELVKVKESLSKTIASLATKMRLTQQSRYTPQASNTANKKANRKRPWES